MIRQIFSLALGFSLASAAVDFASSSANAADPAQRVARVGFVSPQSPATFFSQRYETAFWERLRGLGWVQDQNLFIEERWAEGRYDRLPTLMAEVLERRIDVLVTYTTQAAIAAKNASNHPPAEP